MRHFSSYPLMLAGRKLARDCAGAAAAEFGMVLPMLLLLLIGMVEFGLTINNYIMVTDAASAGGRLFSISRGATSPYEATVSQIYQAAPNLDQSTLTITLSVNGTLCDTDTACSNELASAQGQPAQVIVAYPCNLALLGYNFAPNCTVSSQVTEIIE
jgi:Flp pilus assembly protein TadG